MKAFSSFAVSCIGASHLRREQICQDFSLCADREDYSFSAVADGHGSLCYLRTDRGSRFAAECALECVDIFMESIEQAEEILESERERQQLLNQLWRSIISRWHERVEADYAAEPFTEDELAQIPEKYAHYRDYYEKGRYIFAYGTTLVFAVAAKNFAFCIQIGDGSCAAIMQDSTVIAPIPDDPECHDNVTSSMCQDNAALCSRNCYFSGKNMPDYIFLGTDGIGNSYCSLEQLHGFYKGLAQTIEENGLENGKAQLVEFLPEMTRKGSGDDVSCAGIVLRTDTDKEVSDV